MNILVCAIGSSFKLYNHFSDSDVEGERHFLIKCPLYENQRERLFQTCRESCQQFDSLVSDENKFVFIMTNEDERVMRSVAKFISDSFKFRETALD